MDPHSVASYYPQGDVEDLFEPRSIFYDDIHLHLIVVVSHQEKNQIAADPQIKFYLFHPNPSPRNLGELHRNDNEKNVLS
jgi:hypothetical protein